MKLIDSKVELLEQGNGLEGIYKQIELCGRTCYKSEDHMTEDSSERFVNAMIKNNHTAMLEHGTVYLIIPDNMQQAPIRYINNQYSKVKNERDADGKYCWFITTNYRVIIQNHFEDDLQYISECTTFHAKRYTFRITCDRGVSHEIVRHRKMSFAQESTRYCNYSKDKFGREVTYIKPSFIDLEEGSYKWTGFNYGDKEGFWCGWKKPEEPSILDNNSDLGKEISTRMKYHWFLKALEDCEYSYFRLLDSGWIPQQARAVLPNALKTEICVTGFEDDWRHFLDLRYYGKTGKPHPDMYKVAESIYKCFEQTDRWITL